MRLETLRTCERSSSGWASLNPPFVALVTGVRSAETKTTSLADILRIFRRPFWRSVILGAVLYIKVLDSQSIRRPKSLLFFLSSPDLAAGRWALYCDDGNPPCCCLLLAANVDSGRRVVSVSKTVSDVGYFRPGIHRRNV